MLHLLEGILRRGETEVVNMKVKEVLKENEYWKALWTFLVELLVAADNNKDASLSFIARYIINHLKMIADVEVNTQQ